ncbi:MAG: hypothetical protein ACKVVT_18615 [Dehalococcoidia bacterium]
MSAKQALLERVAAMSESEAEHLLAFACDPGESLSVAAVDLPVLPPYKRLKPRIQELGRPQAARGRRTI